MSRDDPSRRLRVILGPQAFAEKNSGGASLTIAETKLRTNAPNPFTESTTIAYQLAEAKDVRIAIYDVLGRRLEVMVDERRERGLHHLTWRPTEGQSVLGSGVYFCRMVAGDKTSTQKLVLVR